MKVPDMFVGKRLFTGVGKPELLGRGDKEVRGSAYVEGPEIVGDPELFSPQVAQQGPSGPEYEVGVTMASQNHNDEYLTGVEKPPFYAFFARVYARIAEYLKVDTFVCTKTIKAKIIYSEVIMANIKNFVIPHPTKEGKNLVYACLEGPENGIYVRGRLRNSTRIELPDYWRDLVSTESITVSITPAGVHQNIIIRGVYNTHIEVQSMETFPINCHYHVFAERRDVKKLKTEVDA
jgi:hypothetical protein